MSVGKTVIVGGRIPLRPGLLIAAGFSVSLVAVQFAGVSAASSSNSRSGQGTASQALKQVSAHGGTRASVDLGDGLSPIPVGWKEHFEQFVRSDRSGVFRDDVVGFVGSSSIDYWTDVEAQFPFHHVVRRGLPGATMADCARHVDRLILPYRPRVVVVYAGENDLANGSTPEQVVAAYADLVRQVHEELPATKLVFVSIKPSPSRIALMPLIRRTNSLMAAYAETDRRLDFVNVHSAMLDGNQRARRELFRVDGVHMTPAGYALWRDAIVKHID